MVALWNRADHYIFALWFLSSSLFPRLISAVADWMSAILPHMVWPSDAGLKRAACGSLKIQTQKKSPKISIWHHGTILSGYIFARKTRIDNRKKVVKQQYLLQMSSQYGELRPTNGCYGWISQPTSRYPPFTFSWFFCVPVYVWSCVRLLTWLRVPVFDCAYLC